MLVPVAMPLSLSLITKLSSLLGFVEKVNQPLTFVNLERRKPTNVGLDYA